MGITRTLDVDEILARQESGELKRHLRGRDLVGFGVGIIIGTGIFTLAGVEAKTHAGPAVTLSFVIGAVVAGLAALCYAELASSVPTAGSAYTYAFATLGEVFAWIIGWDLLLEFALGAAVVSRGWSGYLANLLGLPAQWFGEQATVNVGAVAIITNVLVIVKVAVCALILAVGVFYVRSANLTPFIPPAQPSAGGAGVLHQPVVQAGLGLSQTVYGLAGVVSAAAIVFFAYTGFEALANLGEETRNPRKDLRVGILGALGVCALLYIGWGTPHLMTISGAIVIAALAAFGPITELSDMVSIGALSAMIIVAVAVPVLRRRRPDLNRPFTVPFSPVVPILAAVACFYLMLNLDVLTWVRFAVWLALGLLIYFGYGRKHSRLATATGTEPAQRS
jgi:APA family basic amino acid/polyamine antiporter